MKKTVWLGIAFVVMVVLMVVLSTMGTARHRVEVCMEFNGRTACRVASASTEQHALRTAAENACALISSGVTDSIACGNKPPASVKWLSRK